MALGDIVKALMSTRNGFGARNVAEALEPKVEWRGSMLPIVNYDDGSGGFGWPQVAVDAKNALGRFGRSVSAALGDEWSPEETFPRPEDAVLPGLAVAGSGLGHLGLRGRIAGSVAGAERAEASSGLPSIGAEAGRTAPPFASASSSTKSALDFDGRLGLLREQIPTIRPGDDFIAQTPFDYLRATELPEGSAFAMDAWRKNQTRYPETVNLRDLNTLQPGVDGMRVQQIADGGPLDASGLRDASRPAVWRLPSGQLVVQDGNHRLAAAALRGETTADVDIIGGLPSHSVEAGSAPVTARAYRGTGYPDQDTGPTYFASDNPSIASTYAQGPNPSVIPSDITFRNPMVLDAAGGSYDSIPGHGSMFNAVEAAKQAGNDGLVIRNIVDPMKGYEGPPATTYAALKPGTVKSATTGETLFSNAPDAAPVGMLAMDVASRMERARAQGFDPQTTWYHGTGEDFSEFKPGSPTYMTTDPAEASRYAGIKTRYSDNPTPAVYPLNTRGKFATAADLADAEKALGGGYQHGRDVNAELARRGFDGYRDGDFAYVFDPKNIRSKFAAFDPAKSDSANLLASNPQDAAPAGLLATDTEDDDLPQIVRSLLRHRQY
jgi:hypothetical protein